MKIPGYIFILLPIIELVIFIEVGSYIGSFNVIISIIFTIFLGYYLIKSKIKNISLNMMNISNIQDVYQQYTSSFYSFLSTHNSLEKSQDDKKNEPKKIQTRSRHDRIR